MRGRDEVVVDGGADAVGGEGEGVTGAKFFVERGGRGGGRGERFLGEAALLAENREVLDGERDHGAW